jgi:hypothetical protein
LPSKLNHHLICNSGHVFQECTLPKPQTVAVSTSTEAPTVNSTVTKAAPPTPVTPQNPNATSLPPQPPSSGSGRMVTRVSSGAIRHKSVGELLGEKEVPPDPPLCSNDPVHSQAHSCSPNRNIPRSSQNKLSSLRLPKIPSHPSQNPKSGTKSYTRYNIPRHFSDNSTLHASRSRQTPSGC